MVSTLVGCCYKGGVLALEKLAGELVVRTQQFKGIQTCLIEENANLKEQCHSLRAELNKSVLVIESGIESVKEMQQQWNTNMRKTKLILEKLRYRLLRQ